MPQRKISLEMTLALLAVLISTLTLFVYIRQANIMQDQQRTSVWPYVEVLPSWGPHGLYLVAENKGVGPALVKDVIMTLDGKRIGDLDSVFLLAMDTTFTEYGYSTLNGRVLAAGEKIQVFQIDNPEVGDQVRAALMRKKFEYEVCYCSIYEDCWTSRGLEVIVSDCGN